MEEKKAGTIPARYVVALLGCLGIITTYLLRADMNVAIVAMVHQSSNPSNPLQDPAIACVELLPETTRNGTPFPRSSLYNREKFNWSSNIQGLVLGSFFVGYTISQIPGGIMAKKFGGKRMVTIGVTVATIISLLIPLAAHWNVWAVIIARLIQGLFEGVIFPSINTLISCWAPKMERSRMSSFIYTGVPLGIVLSFTLSGLLSSSNFLGGWPSVFYVFGGIACVWLVLWNFLVFETPDKHPRISKEELSLIRTGQDERKKRTTTPWREIFTSVPVWALIITHIGQNWGFIAVVTELPTYMANVLHFDVKENGALSSVPHLIKVLCGLLAGCLADYLRKSGYFRITSIRKIMNSIAFFGTGICILAVVFVGCQSGVIVLLFILAMGFNGFIYSGFFVTHVDMSPDYAGLLMGITNSIANLTGFIVPAFVGKVIEDGQTLHNWSKVFVTTAAIYFVCGIIFHVFGSAELQTWNTTSSEPEVYKEGRFSKRTEEQIEQNP